jgi:hypothetical protein
MRPPRVLLCLFLLLTAALSASDLVLPRAPSLPFATVDGKPALLSGAQIHEELQQVLPRGTKLRFDHPAPTQGAATSDHPPVPVVAVSGKFPLLDLADDHYGKISSDYLPVLLDWIEELARAYQIPLADLPARGLTVNKLARLARVFTSIRLYRDGNKDIGVAPAIGWCRVYLRQPWGHYAPGETKFFIVTATERGWLVIDPLTRHSRHLSVNDERWLIEFIVI